MHWERFLHIHQSDYMHRSRKAAHWQNPLPVYTHWLTFSDITVHLHLLSFTTIKVPSSCQCLGAVACRANTECILRVSQTVVSCGLTVSAYLCTQLKQPPPSLDNISSTLPSVQSMRTLGPIMIMSYCQGHLEFHSTFCLSLRLRKPGLTRMDTQGLTLWKSHWKARKLVTEMVRISWLNGSMATRVHCGRMERRRVQEKWRSKECPFKTF